MHFITDSATVKCLLKYISIFDFLYLLIMVGGDVVVMISDPIENVIKNI